MATETGCVPGQGASARTAGAAGAVAAPRRRVRRVMRIIGVSSLGRAPSRAALRFLWEGRVADRAAAEQGRCGR
jgi:hypothetical protein